MRLRQLDALLAVAEHGTFSAAARALHTVQSNVSSQVARLEREMGVLLIDRTSGLLTDEGEVVAARARRINAELDALTSDVAAVRNVVVGHVRLGMIGSVGRWLVPPLIEELDRRHPDVDLVVVDATTTSLLPQLLNGGLDLAVLNLPIPDAAAEVEPLFHEERVLVVPSTSELARRDEVSLAELADHPLLLEPQGTAFRDELDAAARDEGVRLRPMAEVDGVTLVTSLAVGGFGPAILPTTATLDQPAGGWTRVHVPELRYRDVGLVRQRDARLSAAGRAVRDLVRGLVAAEIPTRDGVEPPDADLGRVTER